jgi:sterol desaturase/sphingolipid hydroxylase (fatty acid hydroxylase superfamily)
MVFFLMWRQYIASTIPEQYHWTYRIKRKLESEFVIGGVDWTQTLYLFTLCALILCMVLEALFPRRSLRQPLLWRWGNNFSLALVTWYTSVVASSLFVVYAAQFTNSLGFGLLPALNAGPLLSFTILLLVVQLSSYVIHIAFHKIPLLWPLHAIHHSDVEIDISTSYRHHPLEPLVSLPLMVPLVLLLGAPVEVAVTYKALEIFMAVFNHSNLRLPAWLDRILRLVLVTPDFHRLHHCSQRQFTDSNYGGVVPWFDYLFGTASNRPYAEQESMELGLEYQREPADSRLDRMILAPFTASGQDLLQR